MHVTVLRPEVRIPRYFNRKIHTFMFVKGGLAFALSLWSGARSLVAGAPGPSHHGQLGCGTTAGVYLLPPHLAP